MEKSSKTRAFLGPLHHSEKPDVFSVSPVPLRVSVVTTTSFVVRAANGQNLRHISMPDPNRIESIAKYVAIFSAFVAATVGIAQYRRGVSQTIREPRWTPKSGN
jgi:hypothetical protein